MCVSKYANVVCMYVIVCTCAWKARAECQVEDGWRRYVGIVDGWLKSKGGLSVVVERCKMQDARRNGWTLGRGACVYIVLDWST